MELWGGAKLGGFCSQSDLKVPGYWMVLVGRRPAGQTYVIHLEVDAKFMVIAALKSLVERNEMPVDVLTKAIAEYGMDADKINPQFA